jgi:hypothetical protein
MCHAITSIHCNVWFLSLILLLFLRAESVLLDFGIISLISIGNIDAMPVITRSMAKGGLQDNITSAPLPYNCPTCTNAMAPVSSISDYNNSPSSPSSLLTLVNHSALMPSSLERDSVSASSLLSHFEIPNFENFKLDNTSSLLSGPHFEISHNFDMEADCKEEPRLLSTSSSSNDEILKILTAILSQMVVGHQDLQSQLVNSNQSLKAELQKVREENEKFKQEIWAEMQRSSSLPTTSAPIVQSSTSMSASMPVASVPSSNSAVDFQTQMLNVLNDTFAKLSSVISDKSSETKSDWIKFSGDPKKFCSWYHAIMAQLSIAPWTPLYDSTTNSVVKVTLNDVLNGKLYAKIIGTLEGSALQHMLARKHVRANCILLLKELHQMYKPK